MFSAATLVCAEKIFRTFANQSVQHGKLWALPIHRDPVARGRGGVEGEGATSSTADPASAAWEEAAEGSPAAVAALTLI